MVAQMVKNLPAMQETPGQKDPLEKGMVTHSSILAWRSPWTEKPGGLQSMGLQSQTQHDLATNTFTFKSGDSASTHMGSSPPPQSTSFLSF